MQGGWFWDSWTPHEKQGAGMLASTFGMMALGAFAPEMMGESAELGELGEMTGAEAAEAGKAGEMTAAERSSLADEESSMSQYYKKGSREPKLSQRYDRQVVSGDIRETNPLLEINRKSCKAVFAKTTRCSRNLVSRSKNLQEVTRWLPKKTQLQMKKTVYWMAKIPIIPSHASNATSKRWSKR
jgi:hypothetical protein